ncbi:hypothetical protein BDZ91DRAFT_768139 [Kalaharituber pfeilii]|nr:hypothetical protein BDZ91DRAFT_768139 [Kalaharituber pfeilii]
MPSLCCNREEEEEEEKKKDPQGCWAPLQACHWWFATAIKPGEKGMPLILWGRALGLYREILRTLRITSTPPILDLRTQPPSPPLLYESPLLMHELHASAHDEFERNKFAHEESQVRFLLSHLYGAAACRQAGKN